MARRKPDPREKTGLSPVIIAVIHVFAVTGILATVGAVMVWQTCCREPRNPTPG